MTNEEIEQEAERVYAELAREVGKGGSAVQIPLIASSLRALVSQAYEEAARTHCWSCRDGEAPTFDTGRGVHTHAGGAYCKASEIHHLKDALARQAVLTS